MPEQVFSGKYIVQEILAKGGMGIIYKALDRTLSRIVVIKAVHEHFAGDPAFTDRFLREARAMARLDHENIVTIHAVEEERGTPYIVMEYFPGRNLRSYLQAHQTVPLRTSVEIALQVAEALAYAHDQGIIHRDIKPANILIGSRTRVKLTDFGIAAALDDVSITTAGQILGTPEYMSPEQSSGEKVDCRTDLYSLGIVLYEMIVGHHPFARLSRNAIQTRLRDRAQEIHLDFPDEVPSLIKAIIEDLVRRDRTTRTGTARLLVTQLKECLQILPPPPESTEEERTVVTAHERPFVSSPPPPPAPFDTPSSRRAEGLPSGSAKQTDVRSRDPRQGQPQIPSMAQPFWRRYNLLPLMVMVGGAALVFGILVFLVNVNKWQPMSPTGSSPQKEQLAHQEGRGESERTETQGEKGIAPIQQTGPPKPVRPKPVPEGVTQVPLRRQLDLLLRDFQTAYERQDMQSLRRLSDIGQERQIFLDMMASHYSSIKTSIRNVEIKDGQATASLIHEELIDKSGEPVAPDQILRSVRIKVSKDGDQWGKVIW